MRIYRSFLFFSFCLVTFIVNAEQKIHSFNDGIKAQIKSVSDCIPNLNGKVSLGDDKYTYNWECRSQSGNAQYNTAYMSKFDFVFASKDEAEIFFNQYVTKKTILYHQSVEITDLKYSILSISYKSKESSQADYLMTYKWNGELLLKQGRIIFKNGYIADWSIKSEAASGKAAEEFNNYVKYFEITPL